jgi:hypothetical protein
MQTTKLVPTPQQTVIETTRQLLEHLPFQQQHRGCDKDFTRRRDLPFSNVVVFLMQKTVRSIQAHLHDFFDALGRWSQSVTPSAWCQARMKLRHTAFVELNQRAILDQIYRAESGFVIRRWKGHRLIGIDSSLIRLPNAKKIGEEFGWVECANNQGDCGRYPQGRLSALTDLLNRIVIEAIFVPWKEGERDLAAQHLAALASADISILDRGFASYILLAQFVAHQRFFVCRCPKSSFAVVNRLFQENKEGRSVIAEVRVHHENLEAVRQAGLPEVITVRFVTLRLSTGELEVLATNLLDEQRYPTSEFAELYHYRWGIETYYGLIKGRLDLENFTGRTPEALRQDVHSTVFLSNLESVFTRPADDELETHSQSLQHPQQVNHAVCFHALKTHIIALLLSKEPIAQTEAKLQKLFLDNPVSFRPGRKTPRIKQSAWRSYHHQRNTKKSVF